MVISHLLSNLHWKFRLFLFCQLTALLKYATGQEGTENGDVLPKERLAGETTVATVVNMSHSRVPTDPAEDLAVPPCAWAAPHRLPNQGSSVDVEGRALDLLLGGRLGLASNTSTATLSLASLLRLASGQTSQVVHIPWRGRTLTPHWQLEVKVCVHGEVAGEGGILVAGVVGHQGCLPPMLRQWDYWWPRQAAIAVPTPNRRLTLSPSQHTETPLTTAPASNSLLLLWNWLLCALACPVRVPHWFGSGAAGSGLEDRLGRPPSSRGPASAQLSDTARPAQLGRDTPADLAGQQRKK